MKLRYLLIIAFLLIPTFGFAQKKYSYEAGRRFIKKAEKNLAKDNYRKTRKYIKKAKNSSGGYCGLGAIMTDREITKIEVELLTKQKKYDELLVVLDSAKKQFFGGGNDQLDSLEVQTLILKYGKEKVTNAFSKVETYETIQSENIFYVNLVYLADLDYKFYFSFSFREEDRYNTSKTKIFIEEARHHSFYNLLIN